MTPIDKTKLAAWVGDVVKVQDYSAQQVPHGVGRFALKRFTDDGGSFQELMRLIDGRLVQPDIEVQQVNYAVMEPGTIKAWHLHLRQHDVWFVPPECKLIVGLLDCRPDAALKKPYRTVLGDGKSELLSIPPGVAHGASNPYPERAVIIYGVSEWFDPDDPDELRLPWNYVGNIWEVQPG